MCPSFKTVCRICAVLLLATAFWAIASRTKAEDYEYKVTGVNIRTQERVVGHITDSDHNGTVSGIIWDRMCIYPVKGTWSGKGLMRLYSTLSSFTVTVVEE